MSGRKGGKVGRKEETQGRRERIRSDNERKVKGGRQSEEIKVLGIDNDRKDREGGREMRNIGKRGRA